MAETSNWRGRVRESERESDHIINLYCFVLFSNFALLSPAVSPSPTPSRHLRLSLSVILFRIRLQLEFIAKCLWLFNVFN